MPRLTLPLAVCAFATLAPAGTAAAPDTYSVGVARVDITPAYPIRLSGFGFRRTESEGVTRHISAKALAIDDGEPAVLLTVDALAISGDIVREVAGRLERKAGLKPDRLAVTVSHSHTTPMLSGLVPTLFGQPIPKEHQEHIDRYTREFTDNLEKVALAALADRKPARLTWGTGKVGFAINRRTKSVPVDHDLPILVVRDAKDDAVRAVYVSYACHCVTLSNNKISGDWAGYAQETIENTLPGAVAFVSIGCAGDQNPRSGVSGDKAELAVEQAAEITREVKRLLGGYLAPVTGKLTASVRKLELPLAVPPREEFERKASQRTDAIGYHARVQLAKLDRGEKLLARVEYPVKTWAFGDALAMVFLPGEVVVDYSLRLKRELDGRRLWVNAYSNDVPGYVPSERVLKEGGYEGGGAMVYYDKPGPFQPGLEQPIIDAVREQIGERFRPPFDPKKTGGSLPLSPQQSAGAIRTKPGLTVELVAAEPAVTDPVAIDWGPDGRLYVAEMVDYPAGKAGDYKPGGRIRLLRDSTGTGRHDTATVFLDNIPFPTGVTAWRNGVLICAAPDILYAEDTDGDGKADVVKKLFSGFGTGNYQARVNSLEYGLDGWVYGSCGLFGGTIRSFNGKDYPLGDRDFRIRPDTGELEPATGRTQQGRARNDWGDWFGCDNSNLGRHYVLADHYLRRNPHAAVANPAANLTAGPDANRLFPGRPDIQLFKLSGPPGHTTAACGLGVYRDELLGPGYTGNVFTCEPVNLIVHRLKLEPSGSTFTGRRPADETTSEFLSSSDTWSRFVQARTGPDGALWVVDMYRFVIEHPRWIPAEDVARLDLRAGSTMGRIYRVYPTNHPPRPMPRLDRLDTAGLVAVLDSPNGWQRDMATQMLVWRNDRAALRSLRKLIATSPRPEARLHALCVLDGLDLLCPSDVERGLTDPHPCVRRHAVRLAEQFLDDEDWAGTLGKLVADPDAQVRLQVACSLGEWKDARGGRILAGLAVKHADDPYLTAAVLSSLRKENVREAVAGVLAAEPSGPLVERLLSVAVALGDADTLSGILAHLAPHEGRFAPWQLSALAGVLEALDRQGRTEAAFVDGRTGPPLAALLDRARAVAADERAPVAERVAALRVLGRGKAERRAAELAAIDTALTPQAPAALQAAAVAALARTPDHRAAERLIESWAGFSPSLKAQALDALLSRDPWQRQLLAAVQKGRIPAPQIDAPRRQRLLAHPDERVRAAAATVFAGGVNPDRQKVLDAYRDVLTTPGDPVRGKAVFLKTCATCHRSNDGGHAVGPDVPSLAGKSAAYLLTEILDPNRNVDTRYVQYDAQTKAGRVFSGVLAGETATSVTLRGPEGKEQVLLREELDELRSNGRSLMPEGLEKDLSRQDLADVIAYVAGSGPPASAAAVKDPPILKPAAGRFALLATNCAIRGGDITFEPEFRNVGMWHGPQDHVVWRVQLDQEARFDVYLDYACADGSAGNAFVLEGTQPPVRGTVAGTGGWDRYREVKVGTATLGVGLHRLTLRPDGDRLRGALLDLRGVHLVPVGAKP
jgi:putative membrane-bound dehydrogenase-like protein